MSSILDALNKLEQEKTARHQEQPIDLLPATPEEAAADLVSDSPFYSSTSMGSVQWKPVAAALLLGIAITSVTVVTTVWLVAGPATSVAAPADTPVMPAQAVAVVAAAPAEAEEAPALVHTYTVPVVSVPETAPEPAPAPVPAVRQEAPAPVVAQPPRQPEPRPAPAPKPVVQAAVPPVSEPRDMPAAEPQTHPLPDAATVLRQAEEARREPPPAAENVILAQAPALPAPEIRPLPQTPALPAPEIRPMPVAVAPPVARAASGPVDINDLPRLSAQDRELLGLDAIRLNVLRPADKDQPDALAIINLKKVYVGEMIPGTQARLIGVEAGAIGIEVNSAGTPKRFRLPR